MQSTGLMEGLMERRNVPALGKGNVLSLCEDSSHSASASGKLCDATSAAVVTGGSLRNRRWSKRTESGGESDRRSIKLSSTKGEGR